MAAKKVVRQRMAVDLVALTDPGDSETVEIMLSPWGEVQSKNGPFVMDEESTTEILAEFAKGKKPIPIDYEHTTLGGNYATPSGAAPAAGWIIEMHAKPGVGLFAMVKWNAAAVNMIRGDEYRYLSPVLSVRKDNRKAVALTSAALTNVPAILDMERVAAKDAGDGEGVEMMDLKDLRAALLAAGVKLADDADDGAIALAAKMFVESVAKAKAESPPLAAIASKLGLPANSSIEVVQARIGELQVSVPAAEYKTVTDRLAKLEGIARDREGQEVIGYAIETAKINPNHEPSMAQYRMMARNDPIAFRQLVDSMPPLYSVGRLIRGRSELDGDDAANEEKLIAKEVALHGGDKKKALIALQEKLIGEQTAAGLRKDVAIERCMKMHPMIFGGSR